MRALNDKQKAFVDEYLIDLNASAAARRAGYSPKWINANVQHTLQKTAIQAAIKEKMSARADRVQIDQDFVLKRIKDVLEDASKAPDGDMIDRNNALKALEMLAKHVGLFGKDNLQKGKADQEAQHQVLANLFAAVSGATRGLPPSRQLEDKE